MLTYFRGRWPDDEVPTGEPLWLYYEVDSIGDAVLRSVEMFEDGHLERNSVELERRNGGSCVSIVEEPFKSVADTAQLDAIEAAEFDELWTRSVDKPVT